MATYIKTEKETSTYTKPDRSDKGWFKQGWFMSWFAGEIYRKVEKVVSTYTKTEK